jgi:hypothetical protein
MLAPEWKTRPPQARLGAIRQFWPVASALIVHLERR